MGHQYPVLHVWLLHCDGISTCTRRLQLCKKQTLQQCSIRHCPATKPTMQLYIEGGNLTTNHSAWFQPSTSPTAQSLMGLQNPVLQECIPHLHPQTEVLHETITMTKVHETCALLLTPCLSAALATTLPPSKGPHPDNNHTAVTTHTSMLAAVMTHATIWLLCWSLCKGHTS